MSAPGLVPFDTPHGPARVLIHAAPDPVAALLLGHGAGGSLAAPDLQACAEVALAAGISVALVEQPYRVAGRRAPAPARQLDTAWLDVAEQLRAGPLAGLPLLAGGRSSGARVACRTAAALGAAGVLCLAFPLRPVPRPGRPQQDRSPELDALDVPVLVVQGDRDPFGIPESMPPLRTVARVPGTHTLRGELAGLRDALATWLPTPLSAGISCVRPRPRGRPGAGTLGG